MEMKRHRMKEDQTRRRKTSRFWTSLMRVLVFMHPKPRQIVILYLQLFTLMTRRREASHVLVIVLH